jgi:copper homeostasis protein
VAVVLLEIAVTTVEDALIAQEHGADRMVVMSSVGNEGVTPSFGLVEEIKKFSFVPLSVLIQPHCQTYAYNKYDVKTMCRDIEMMNELKVEGVSFGCLTKEGEIDKEMLELLLYRARGMHVSFHNAFDFIKDQGEALELLAQYKEVKSVWTSGRERTALNGLPHIKRLLKKSNRPHLTACRGLKPENLKAFLDVTDVEEVHLFSGVRESCHVRKPISAKSVAKAKEIVEWINKKREK